MITVRKRPYEINWSGNQIVYSFFSQEAVTDKDLVFEVKLFFKSLAPGAAFKQVCVIPLTPVDGAASIDVSELLRSQLELSVPSLSIEASIAQKQSGIFYIQYRQYNINIQVEEGWVSTEVEFHRVVVKGGIAPFLWKGNNYWINYHQTFKPFLTWQKRGRLASINERLYLSWINLTNLPSGKIHAILTCTYTDASTAEESLVLPVEKHAIAHIPVGATELGFVDPDKTIWFWDIGVYDMTNAAAPQLISEKFRYHLDQRKDYNQLTLHYSNSLGGFDSARVRGVIETNITLEGADSESIVPFEDGAVTLPRLDRSLPHREVVQYKGDIGHLDKTEQDRLRDAFLTREVWMERFGRWWPVKLLTKQYKQGTTQDKRFTLPIEWSIADGGSYHYTPMLDLGDGILINNVCTATIGSISHTLSYFAGNTVGDVKISFNVNDPDGENISKIQYRVPGIQEDWKDFAYPYVQPLQMNLSAPSNRVVYMRAVCHAGSYGPVAMYEVSVPAVGVPPQVANSTVYNESNVDTPYSIVVNGQAITGGSIGANSYVPFRIAPGVYNTITLNLGFIAPVQGTLQDYDEVITLGNISGTSITWHNITVDNTGIIIKYH